MNYKFSLLKEWPKLAWVCILDKKKNNIDIFHGPNVESGKDWIVEGVWDGDFEKGDFDKTDLIFGSGVRFRNNSVVFVSAGSGMERLWYADYRNIIFVANNLPGLLSVSGFDLLENYRDYFSDLASAERVGLFSCIKKIPSTGPDLNIVYFNNLIFENQELKEAEKPFNKKKFEDFKDYESYLIESAEKIGKNSRSGKRKFKIEMLVGLSTGYDSIATAVISKYAGCKKSVSIKNATSIWKRSDSGEKIAQYLKLDCSSYVHKASKYKNEISSWAVMGHGGGRNMTVFDFPEPLGLFFSGNYGDTVWERNSVRHKEPKVGMNMMLCEFRVIQGLFITTVPWWGIRNLDDIYKISNMEEMKKWRLSSDYDRPVARRIIEEAGVPRGEFALKKYNTASNSPFWWPGSVEARNSFNRYLKQRGKQGYSNFKADLLSIIYKILYLTDINIFRKLNIKSWKPWLKTRGRDELFVWANHSMKKLYPFDSESVKNKTGFTK